MDTGRTETALEQEGQAPRSFHFVFIYFYFHFLILIFLARPGLHSIQAFSQLCPMGFSYFRTWALEHIGFSYLQHVGSLVVVHRLS